VLALRIRLARKARAGLRILTKKGNVMKNFFVLFVASLFFNACDNNDFPADVSINSSTLAKSNLVCDGNGYDTEQTGNWTVGSNNWVKIPLYNLLCDAVKVHTHRVEIYRTGGNSNDYEVGSEIALWPSSCVQQGQDYTFTQYTTTTTGWKSSGSGEVCLTLDTENACGGGTNFIHDVFVQNFHDTESITFTKVRWVLVPGIACAD